MDQAPSTLPPGAKLVPAKKRSKRPLIIFAVIGLLLALSSGGLYVYRATDDAAGSQSSPEAAVKAFLTATVLTNDESRLSGIVCESWTAQDALRRTRSALDTTATISWSDVRIVTSEPGRASVSVRLTLRKPSEIRPGQVVQWRFSAVEEDGWRICEARPFIS